MWSVEPEQIWKKHRTDGISGFMRLQNEAEFADRAIATHIDGVDELVIVTNNCSDDTPAICRHWERLYPDKIRLQEYEPKLIASGTPEALTIDSRSPHCMANLCNYALALTNRKIVIQIGGDDCAVSARFGHVCDYVRRALPRKARYPIYGLNLALIEGHLAIYNSFRLAAGGPGDRARKQDTPPVIAGDQCFYYVDETCWHTIDPVMGSEVMDHKERPQVRGAPQTYVFFRLKEMSTDRSAAGDIVTIEDARRHHPAYFRGADIHSELEEMFSGIAIRHPFGPPHPKFSMREHWVAVWSKARLARQRTGNTQRADMQ